MIIHLKYVFKIKCLFCIDKGVREGKILKMKNSVNNTKGIIRFLKNINLLPKYFSDKEVDFYRKTKVALLLIFMIGYFIMPLDLIADFLFFGLGYLEDIVIIVFFLDLISAELEKYRLEILNRENDDNVIELKNRKKDSKIIDVEYQEKKE